ncbi:MAG: hypothetical protein WC683_13045 [bacterium]
MARYDRESHSLRTCAGSSLFEEDSNEFCGTLPRTGGMLSGELWPLRMWEPIIGGSGCGLLPTPAAQEPGWANRTPLDKDGNEPEHGNQRWYDAETGRVMQKGLTQVLQRLPTSSAEDAKSSGGAASREDGRQMMLHHAAKLLPTPATRDHHAQGAGMNTAARSASLATTLQKTLLPSPNVADATGGRTSKGSKRPGEGGLRSTILATPQARDYRSGEAHRWEGTERSRNLNDQMAAQTGKRTAAALNPTFVAWMMGWPLRWLDLPAPTGGPRGRRGRASRPSPPESPSEPTSSAPSGTAGLPIVQLTWLDAFRRGYEAWMKERSE